MLDVPFAMADASSLTAAGYVGEDVENVVRKLVENADGDIEKAQRGICYIDEIDKLSRKGENLSITRDVGGEGVQQALLKIVEGAEIEVALKGQRKHPMAETIKIDTTNILFIVGGSFEGIDKIIQERKNKNKKGLGFGAEVHSKKEIDINECILEVESEDLRKFGMLPEFVGRFPILSPMQQLSENALMKILIEPKNALLKQYKELLKMDNVEIEFTQDALKEIVAKAIKKKTGARSLRSILEETLLPHMFSIPDQKNLLKITINKDCVLKTGDPIFQYKEQIPKEA